MKIDRLQLVNYSSLCPQYTRDHFYRFWPENELNMVQQGVIHRANPTSYTEYISPIIFYSEDNITRFKIRATKDVRYSYGLSRPTEGFLDEEQAVALGTKLVELSQKLKRRGRKITL